MHIQTRPSNGALEFDQSSWLLSVVTSLQKLTQLQAAAPLVAGLDLDPVAVLNSYEKLAPGPWKDHVFARNREFFEVALREKQWRETQAKARADEVALRPKGSLASQYETLAELDPVAGRLFFQKNEEKIKAEAEARRLDHSAKPQTL